MPGRTLVLLIALAMGACSSVPVGTFDRPLARGAGPQVRRVYLTFDEETTQRPMIWELIKKFEVIPNIRSASATEKLAIMAIEFTGAAEQLDAAFAWLKKQNVRVDPIEMNVVEP